MKKFILTEKAKLQCSCGSSLSELQVTSHNFNYVDGFLQATEKDNKPGENIQPFGTCSQVKGTCSPQPLKWEGTVDQTVINGAAAITNLSLLPCALGGMISCKENTQAYSGFEEDIKDSFENETENQTKETEENQPEENEKNEPKAYILLEDGTIKEEEELPALYVDTIYNPRNLKYIDLEEAGQIERTKREDEKTTKRSSGELVEVQTILFKVKNRNKAIEVFEFLAENSEVEWGRLSIKTKRVEDNYIVTSKNEGFVNMSYLLDEYSFQSVFEVEIIHSHPAHLIERNGKSSMFPSGFNSKTGIPYYKIGGRSGGDVANADLLQKVFIKSTLIFQVYDAYNHRYIQYDKDKIYDFKLLIQ